MADHKGLRLTVSWIVLSMTIISLAEIIDSKEVKPENDTQTAIERGNCSCGGFTTETPGPSTEPVLSQSPLVVSCDAAGSATCRSLCVALAVATRAKGPEILCSRLGNATELVLSAFYKACDHPWSYGGLKSEEPLCCTESRVTPCPSMYITTSADVTNMQ